MSNNKSESQIYRSETQKDSKKVEKKMKKGLTKKRIGDIMTKLARESTAPNLENDTE